MSINPASFCPSDIFFPSHDLWDDEPGPNASVTWEGRHGAVWSPDRPFHIKWDVTIEVWVWENRPPLQTASQLRLLAGGGGSAASRQRVQPRYPDEKLWEKEASRVLFPCTEANMLAPSWSWGECSGGAWVKCPSLEKFHETGAK